MSIEAVKPLDAFSQPWSAQSGFRLNEEASVNSEIVGKPGKIGARRQSCSFCELPNDVIDARCC
jgi:hypothetical protein